MNRGQLGETLAAQYLERQGCTVLMRNFRTRYGELDIVAEQAGYLIFAEVKLRKSTRYGTPGEAVTAAKQRKLILAAEEWMQRYPHDGQPRFDVIEMLWPEGAAAPRIRHIQNAFDT